MLAFGLPSGPIWPPNFFCADLIGFLVPRQTVWWGSADFATAISRHFVGDILENGDYLGLVLIVFVEIFRRRFWPAAGRQISHDFVSCDHHRRPRPESACCGMSRYSDALGRLPTSSAYRKHPAGSLHDVRVSDPGGDGCDVVRVVTAAGLPKCVAAASDHRHSVAPNPRASFWISSLDLPAFFTDGTYTNGTPAARDYFAVAVGTDGQQYVLAVKSWHVLSDGIRMDGNYRRSSSHRMPLFNYFYGQIDLPEAGDQLKAYLARFGVTAVVADPSGENFPHLAANPRNRSESRRKMRWCFNLQNSAATFAAYAKLSGARGRSAREQRCGSIQFSRQAENFSPAETIRSSYLRSNSNGSIFFRTIGRSFDGPYSLTIGRLVE